MTARSGGGADHVVYSRGGRRRSQSPSGEGGVGVLVGSDDLAAPTVPFPQRLLPENGAPS